MTIISDYVAFEMREQLLLTQMFYELKGLTEIPLSFADCRFYINKHKNGGLVDLKDLLKKWVSSDLVHCHWHFSPIPEPIVGGGGGGGGGGNAI